MFVRIVFVDGSWFDFQEPEGFNLNAFARMLRCDHFIICDQFYIPEHMIKCILRGTTEAMDMMVSRTNAPTTGTKQ